jgi:hypothetical protein
MNPWHDLPAGPKVPEIVYALAEIERAVQLYRERY